MDESLADWLTLREDTDAVARSSMLMRSIADVLGDGTLRVLDLATGAGSNLRYLIERLPNHQQWLAVDRSAMLLARLRERTSSWAIERGYRVETNDRGLILCSDCLDCEVETRQMDLGPIDDATIFAGRHLVTASALLDLVSDSWLRALAAQCRTARAAALFTIAYNGRSSCVPPEPEDRLVLDLFNQHQHHDKGLGGAAAGPDAVTAAVRSFEQAGYRVATEPSDWIVGTEARALQQYLIEGWAGAALETAPDQGALLASWRDRRLAHVEAGRSRLIVGHHDIAAVWVGE